MTSASDRMGVNPSTGNPALDSLVNRLEALSQEPGFGAQREVALSRALQPYLRYGERVPLRPLPEEVELAKLYVFADFFPEDGQLSLAEQIRDTITTHVPEEERAWLDPLRHSYMDLLEVVSVDTSDPNGRLTLRSLGDKREYPIAGGVFGLVLQPKQVLLTRVIRLSTTPSSAHPVLVGAAVVLSSSMGHALFEAVDQWRRELEAESGSFDLGEWEEFVKRFGHILLWQLAQARLEALLRADRAIRFRTPTGEPFLYALSLYDHHAFQALAEGLAQMEDLQPEENLPSEEQGRQSAGGESRRQWVRRAGSTSEVVVRITLTPVQVQVECDSRERLDEVKHQLASTFGYTLHFRGESTRVPVHAIPDVDLTTEEQAQATVVVEREEERRLLSTFLESVYLEWVDHPAPALNNQTPRHAASQPALRDKVAALIARNEQDDPCLRRTGQPGYDYTILREHVGI